MKKTIITITKVLSFFLGWAIVTALLPLSSSKNPAIWRLWAEITPLVAMIVFTLAFWLIEKKKISLHLFNNPMKGVLTGFLTGIAWLGITTTILIAFGFIEYSGKNSLPLLWVWLIAAFLNVCMQELLVRGYLYQMLKQKHNMIAAVIVTTGLFTGLHGGAFEAGIIPVMNVLTMSLLMTVILEYTGSLIAPTIMHFIWNGIGAIILGGVSLADDYPHLFNLTFSGNNLLSGGACKIEGSIVVLVLNIVLIALFLHLQKKQLSKA